MTKFVTARDLRHHGGDDVRQTALQEGQTGARVRKGAHLFIDTPAARRA
jgi:hypothetical protein